ncbi:hypothetical protein EV424DRAFT_1536679 [Suillus variegatus]|nr:hypothetical protein EV424DRAFT_1536679 [Suillus variegatus]
MEVDDDPNADQTDSNDDESQELEILDSATGPVVPPKIPTPPLTVSKKQKQDKNNEPTIPVTKDISYMVSILSASEMKKVRSKQEPVNTSIDLCTDESWDTLKAQILVKISTAINPHMLHFDDYSLTYHISWVLPKPGLSLLTEADYNGMMKRVDGMAAKALTVNINIIQTQPASNNNKNQGEDESELAKSKTKKQAKTVTGPASSTPVVNITFGNEFAGLFKSNHTAPNTTTSEIGPAPISTSSLIPPLHKPGNDMSIVAFCALYQLDDSITTKFASHSFKEARLLCYVTFSDLKEMEFKFGEIAASRDAVERWSIPTSMA